MQFICSPFAKIKTLAGLIALAVLCAAIDAPAQVRTKKPDRGVYHAPEIDVDAAADIERPLRKLLDAERTAPLKAAPQPQRSVQGSATGKPAKWGAPLVDAELVDAKMPQSTAPRIKRSKQPPASRRRIVSQPTRQPADHGELVRRDRQLAPPHRPQQHGMDVVITGGEVWLEEGEIHDSIESFAPVLEACDGSVCCDSGCDSISSHPVYPWQHHANGYLSCAPDRWFGAAELMLMFRKGDRPPSLVTRGSDADEDTAGELGQLGTQVLVGGDSILKDMTAGGRFTVGTWLDHQRCRSLVFRGWFAGEENFHFSANENQFPVLARPFLNVTDGQDAAQDTLLIAFPNVRSDAAVSVSGKSDVIYGGDISVRQFWHGQYGGTIDLLYGYQYMGFGEDLSIFSTSTSQDEDFAPVGSILTVFDSFDVQNEFHGGQLGIASSYREGCWSFKSLMKIGFGSLRRTARLQGQTTTTLDGSTAVDPNGLLVRSTNAGQYKDHAFAWAPELDFTLGWQRWPMFDVTFGYHIAALTDALQVSGTIDPTLAVNLADPPLGQQRPAAAFRYNTFYVQGIHFGLQYIY